MLKRVVENVAFSEREEPCIDLVTPRKGDAGRTLGRGREGVMGADPILTTIARRDGEGVKGR
jgi:hypothetical protein